MIIMTFLLILFYFIAIYCLKARFEPTQLVNFLSIHSTCASLCLQRSFRQKQKPKNPQPVINVAKHLL